MKKAILSVDAGGQSYKYTLLDYTTLDAYFDPVFIPLDGNGPREHILGVWHQIISKGYEYANANNIEIAAMAGSCPGPFNYVTGTSNMVHKWASIKGVSLPEDFHANGLPADVPVYFCHDANSLILGEVSKGSAIGYKRVAGFIIGTGIGLGGFLDGELAMTPTGSPPYSFWNRPCRDATIEDFAASRGIPRLYSEHTGKPTELTAKDIGDLAQAGDPVAIDCFREAGTLIAEIFAPMAKENNFDCVTFGGRISTQLPFFKDCFAKVLEDQGIKCPDLVLAKGGELMAMIGCANYAKLQMEK